MNALPSHTITVPTHVRDELQQLAASEGRTVDGMIKKLMDEYLWRRDVEEAKRAMRSAPQEVWEEYMREFKAFDATLMDGLKEHPWDEGHSNG
jgi:hypothetical protein